MEKKEKKYGFKEWLEITYYVFCILGISGVGIAGLVSAHLGFVSTFIRETSIFLLFIFMIIQILNTLIICPRKYKNKALSWYERNLYFPITIMIWVIIMGLLCYVFIIPKTVFASSNIGYVKNTTNIIDNINNIILEKDTNDVEKLKIGESIDLSSEQLHLIEENSDLILQLRSEYTDEDTIIFENGSISFRIFENAGYVYQNMKRTGKVEALCGKTIDSADMFIIDYSNNEVIAVYSSQNGLVYHAPGSLDIFYGVIFYEDYNIYVTPPIQIVGGEYYGTIMDINLENKNNEYTSLFQIRLNGQDLIKDDYYSIVSSPYYAYVYLKNIQLGGGVYYTLYPDNSGILSFNGNNFFSLNTNYIMEMTLHSNSNWDIESTTQTFDGSVTNSNIIDLYFDFNSEYDEME